MTDAISFSGKCPACNVPAGQDHTEACSIIATAIGGFEDTEENMYIVDNSGIEEVKDGYWVEARVFVPKEEIPHD